MELAYIRRLTHKTWPYRPAIYSSSHWIFSVKKFHSILNVCCCLFLLCCRFLCSHWHFIFDKSFFVFHLKCVRLFGCCCYCFFTFLFDKQMTYIVSSWIGFINEFFRCFSFFWPKRKSNYLFSDWALVLGSGLVWFGFVHIKESVADGLETSKEITIIFMCDGKSDGNDSIRLGQWSHMWCDEYS